MLRDDASLFLKAGYDLEGLQKSVLRVIDEMGGENLTESVSYTPRGITSPVRKVHDRYWELPRQ